MNVQVAFVQLNKENNMKEVSFKFDLFENVESPLTTGGVITMLGVDEGGNQYFVVSSQQGVVDRWWPESQLKIGQI